MRTFVGWSRRVVGVLAVVALGGCGDKAPTEAEPPLGSSPSIQMPELACTLPVQDSVTTQTCSGPSPGVQSLLGVRFDPMLLGGPWANLVFESTVYDTARGVFSAEVALRNLSGQALGTGDGHSLAPGGVRAVLTALDTSVKLLTVDGRGTFTAAGQPYVQYDEVLQPGNRSSTRTWYWKVPTRVSRIAFKALLVGQVRYPRGWLDLLPRGPILTPGSTLHLSPVLHDPVGTVVAIQPPLPCVCTSDDPTVATFSDDLKVEALRPGKTVVHARVVIGPMILNTSAAVTVVPAPWPASVPTP